MGQGERHEPAIRVEQIDRAPVGDRRHDEVGDLPQGGAAIQRRSEDPAGICEDRGERDVIRVEDRRHRAGDRRLRLLIRGLGEMV